MAVDEKPYGIQSACEVWLLCLKIRMLEFPDNAPRQ
jgi:hypothetical protein